MNTPLLTHNAMLLIDLPPLATQWCPCATIMCLHTTIDSTNISHYGVLLPQLKMQSLICDL